MKNSPTINYVPISLIVRIEHQHKKELSHAYENLSLLILLSNPLPFFLSLPFCLAELKSDKLSPGRKRGRGGLFPLGRRGNAYMAMGGGERGKEGEADQCGEEEEEEKGRRRLGGKEEEEDLVKGGGGGRKKKWEKEWKFVQKGESEGGGGGRGGG